MRIKAQDLSSRLLVFSVLPSFQKQAILFHGWTFHLKPPVLSFHLGLPLSCKRNQSFRFHFLQLESESPRPSTAWLLFLFHEFDRLSSLFPSKNALVLSFSLLWLCLELISHFTWPHMNRNRLHFSPYESWSDMSSHEEKRVIAPHMKHFMPYFIYRKAKSTRK